MNRKQTDIKRWTTDEHSIYNLGFHIIFCPKYRKSVLINGIDERLKEIIKSQIVNFEASLESLEVMPDHVHLFVKLKPTISPHYFIKQIKGVSSKILREEFPCLKSKLPCMWTRSYFIESVGVICEESIKKYIENQKTV